MLKQRLFNLGLAIAFVTTLAIAPSSSLAAELAEIQRRGKLIVGIKTHLRPLSFQDADGNWQGLEIDIARGLAEKILGDPNAIIFKPVANSERLNGVYQDVDLTIARVTVTDSRSRLVDFSPYYYLDGTGFVTKDSAINNLSDLATQTIAVLEYSSTVPVLKYYLPHATLVGVKSYQEALALLEAGEANAFAGDNSVLTGWVQEYPDYQQLPLRLSGAPLAVVMPKGLQYLELRQQVNAAIADWRKSGWLEERATGWGLPWYEGFISDQQKPHVKSNLYLKAI
ncbi:MAG: transporter substrate-binding domain-containing protein [Chroococcales cyanobacterium]